MVYASIKSSEKVFHLPHCKIHTRINRDYRIAFVLNVELEVYDTDSGEGGSDAEANQADLHI